MGDSRTSSIQSLLRSGDVVEIGGRADTSIATHSRPIRTEPSATHLIVAFAAIYLIWGSTYLGIRYAVESIPPLLMMGVRHTLAGSMLYAWTRWRGVPAPRWRDWK